MARVTVEDCLKKIPNRFELVLCAAYLGKKGGKPGNEFEPHLSGKQCFKGILQRKIVRRGGAGTTGSDC